MEKSDYDFIVYTKQIPMNRFMPWYLSIKDVLCDEVVEKCNILVLDENRSGNTYLFLSLYSNFLKLNVKRFFILKTVNAFVVKVFGKVAYLALIKPNIATTCNNTKRNPRKSHLREIIIPDRNDEQ